MANLIISNWATELSDAILDEKVGVNFAPLAGDETFSTYVAEFKPGVQLTPHYHPVGIEIYQILSGNGLMYTGGVNAEGEVSWNTPLEVKEGDFFTIHPKIAHKLENNSDESLILIVTCSPNNLKYNRIIINGEID